MRKWISKLAPWAVTIVLILSLAYLNLNPCRLPIKFSIGQIDSRFNISETDVEKLAIDAADRWNKAIGKNTLVYDPNATFTLNLIYDDRQANRDKLKTEVSGLNLANTDIGTVKQRLDSLLTQYEADLKSYNSQVDYWNSRGGAPTDQYAALQKQKKDLDKRQTDLNKAVDLLNNRINDYNQNAEQLRQEMDQKSGQTEIQGLYQPAENKIDIYTFGDKNELRVTMMHEMGHAIGADHTPDQNSIMYYMIEKQNFNNPTPLAEDLTSADQKCNLHQNPADIIPSIIHRITAKFSN